MFPYLLQLIASEQVDEFVVFAQVEADMALPARWIVSPEYGDAADNRSRERFAPTKPGFGECRTGALDTGLRE